MINFYIICKYAEILHLKEGSTVVLNWIASIVRDINLNKQKKYICTLTNEIQPSFNKYPFIVNVSDMKFITIIFTLISKEKMRSEHMLTLKLLNYNLLHSFDQILVKCICQNSGLFQIERYHRIGHCFMSKCCRINIKTFIVSIRKSK